MTQIKYNTHYPKCNDLCLRNLYFTYMHMHVCRHIMYFISTYQENLYLKYMTNYSQNILNHLYGENCQTKMSVQDYLLVDISFKFIVSDVILASEINPFLVNNGIKGSHNNNKQQHLHLTLYNIHKIFQLNLSISNTFTKPAISIKTPMKMKDIKLMQSILRQLIFFIFPHMNSEHISKQLYRIQNNCYYSTKATHIQMSPFL